MHFNNVFPTNPGLLLKIINEYNDSYKKNNNNAAFKCYWNYRKYEFPNRKLDVNNIKSYLLLGNSEIILRPEFPSWDGHNL